jgi:proteic killer suppression protein
MAIQSIKTEALAAIAAGKMPGKGFPADLVRAVQKKLAMLDAAQTLDDLKFPPGNKLHALSGDRAGQHAIRVNDQFRICFVWAGGPAEVEFIDYH